MFLVGIADWPCLVGWFFWALTFLFLFGEFDPGSGRTLAACLTHASRTIIIYIVGQKHITSGLTAGAVK